MRVYATSLWLPVLSGILLSLTLPYVGVWPLVWVALVPLFAFASNTAQTSSRLVWGTLIFWTIYAMAVVYPLTHISGWWWGGTSDFLGETGGHVMYAFIVGIIGTFVGSFFVPLMFLVRFMRNKTYGVFLIALLWIVIEYLRSNIVLFSFSYGVLGYSLIDTQYLKHVASLEIPHVIGGVYLLSLLIVLGNFALLEVCELIAARSGPLYRRVENAVSVIWDEPKRYVSFCFFVGVFLCAFVFGLSRTLINSDSKNMRVAVIASPLPTDESISEKAYRDYRAKLQFAFLREPELIVLPENAFPYFELNEVDGTLVQNSLIQFQDRAEHYADLLALLHLHPKTEVAVGLHTVGIDHAWYNSIVYYKNGSPIDFYHKRQLVPFAEYLPLRISLWLPESFTAGEQQQSSTVVGLETGALLCSEIGDTSLDLPQHSIILSPSNDSIFVGNTASKVHHQMARMRAIESHSYVLRATKGGISSIIDPNGEVLMSSSDGVLIADIGVK